MKSAIVRADGVIELRDDNYALKQGAIELTDAQYADMQTGVSLIVNGAIVANPNPPRKF